MATRTFNTPNSLDAAATKFIPEVVAAGIEEKLEKAWKLVALCNRKYEGAIKNQGDTVKIRTVGKVSAHPLARNDARTSIAAAEEIEGDFLTLPIDQIVYTNTKVDSIDELATDVSLMDATTKEMAQAIAGYHDTYVADLVKALATADATKVVKDGTNNWIVTKTNAVDFVMDAITSLREGNVPESAPLALVIDPKTYGTLVKAAIVDKTSNNEVYDNGYMGKVLGVDIIMSNNLSADSTAKYAFITVKDKAIAFAQQISKVIHYRDDSHELDADFIKSYSLFGSKVLFPDYMRVLPIAI